MDNVYSTTSSDMFDTTRHTQGGHVHLIQHLWDQYCLYLGEQIKEREEKKLSTVDLPTAKKKATATHFAKWAADFLKANRPVESFFVEENCGLRLTNNVLVAIAPGMDEDIRGTMQSSGAIQVTEGRSQTGNNGVTNSGGTLRI